MLLLRKLLILKVSERLNQLSWGYLFNFDLELLKGTDICEHFLPYVGERGAVCMGKPWALRAQF